MIQLLRVATWNANGLSDRRQELELFINENNIDIILISETRYTSKSYLRIPGYSTYLTNHPSGNSHGGTAVLIKTKYKHYEIEKHEKTILQATSIVVESKLGPISFSAVYCPPKKRKKNGVNIPDIKKTDFNDYFKTLGPRYVAGGDWNSKHVFWGSRMILTRGRQLYASVVENNLNCVSTGKPTYWPTDPQKVPDLLDFFITKGLPPHHLLAESATDLSSDHSPVILTISESLITAPPRLSLTSKYTDWEKFRENMEKEVCLNIPLKTQNDIELAVENMNRSIVSACTIATPSSTTREESNNNDPKRHPLFIRKKISERRHLRRVWHQTRSPEDKNKLNRASRQLTALIENLKNSCLQTYLAQLEPTNNSEHSLWNATKSQKQPTQSIPPLKKPNGRWARSDKEKAITFGEHLAHVFTPFPAEDGSQEQEHTLDYRLQSPYQMSLPIKPSSPQEIRKVLTSLHAKKAPGYDQITAHVLKKFS